MRHVLGEKPIIQDSILSAPGNEKLPFQLLVMNYRCDESILNYVEYCLFNDRTYLTDLTQKGFLTILNYFDMMTEMEEYEEETLPDQSEHELILGVVRYQNDIRFIGSVEDNPQIDEHEFSKFIQNLNSFAINEQLR